MSRAGLILFFFRPSGLSSGASAEGGAVVHRPSLHHDTGGQASIGVSMTLICSNCESHYLIEDYDTRLHYITGYHCGMCGSTKLIEDIQDSRLQVQDLNLQSETLPSAKTPEDRHLESMSPEVNMPHKICEMPGCKKQGVKDRLCTVHYRAKFGAAPRAQQKSYKKTCSVEGCTKQSLTQGVCYQHLTEKCGGVNPYKYPKKKKKAQSDRRPAPSAFVEVAPSVLVPKETKVLFDQINVLHSLSQNISVISRKETITMKVHGEEGGLLEGRISFTYRNGSPPEFNGAGIEGTQDPLSFDDWMFLAAIASEIKRIAGDV